MRILTTERLVLRPFDMQDADAIVASFVDKDMCHGLTVVPHPYALSDAHWFIEHGAQDACAVCTQDGTLVGATGVRQQLGYWVGKPYWGQGFATEAATAVLDDYFTRNDTDVSSSYVDDNAASAAVLAKLGFEITGDCMLHIRSRGAEFPGKSVNLSKARWMAGS